MRQHFDVVRTTRQKHYDKMKLQRLKFFQYHRHMGGKIPNHSYKLGAVQISHPLEQYSPQLLLACSVTPSGKQHSPQWLCANQGIEETRLRETHKLQNYNPATQQGSATHPKFFFQSTHHSESCPICNINMASCWNQDIVVQGKSPEALHSNLLILWYGGMVGDGDSLPDPKA